MALFTEEVLPTSQETSILRGKWDLYFHLPNDKEWNLSSYKMIHKDISNVDELINLNEYLSEKIVNFHPLVNTSTLSLTISDFMNFLIENKKKVNIFDFNDYNLINN